MQEHQSPKIVISPLNSYTKDENILDPRQLKLAQNNFLRKIVAHLLGVLLLI